MAGHAVESGGEALARRIAAAPFALANIAAAIGSVLAVLVLTRLLAAQGYGLYAAVTGLVMIVQNAGYLPIQTGIIRFHAREQDAAARERLATAARLAFLGATGLLGLVWAAAIAWLGQAGVTAEMALAGFVMLVARGWLSLVQAWNRAAGRPWTFFLLEAVQAFGALILALAALQFRPGAAVAIWAGAAAAAVAAGFAPRLLRIRFRLVGTAPLLREFLGYGVPLSIAFLAGAALAVSDRLIIAVHAGAAAAGAYAVAFAIADRAMNLVLLPVPLATKPVLFAAWEAEGESAARPVLLRSSRWLTMLGLTTAAALAVGAAPLARLLAGPDLAPDAAQMVPWLAIGAFLSGLLTHHFSLAFQLSRKTPWMIPVIGVPALLNIVANLVLIPRFGMIAAGWTTVGGYALALGLAIAIGRRHVPIPFPVVPALAMLAVCLALSGLLRMMIG